MWAQTIRRPVRSVQKLWPTLFYVPEVRDCTWNLKWKAHKWRPETRHNKSKFFDLKSRVSKLRFVAQERREKMRREDDEERKNTTTQQENNN